MQTSITRQRIRITTRSADSEGCLLLLDGSLVAVLVQLADEGHGALRGSWFLEAGFGPAGGRSCPVFSTLDAAETWLLRQIQAGDFAMPRPN